ncbi:MAG: succinate dehydrogenase, hydrophobic membrane anchor protein [Methylococcaceae bacterium]|nr:succinate dehydrogenase, hydrophobic membrane anchor protein [Methylococcaceae bacterium]
MNFQSPLARARGLGSVRAGSHHWWRQRVSAVALFPLTLWFGFSLSLLPQANYAMLTHWVSSPWNTLLLLSFILLSLFHGVLGLQTVIEDYVHTDWIKIIGILGVKLVTAFLALASSLAVLRIVLLGGHG